MRKAFLAAVSLVTGLVTFYAAAAGPAAAEPARESRSAAYGLAAEGLLAISPTITTESAFPPGGDNAVTGNFGSPSPTLLTLPLGNLALVGAVGVEANSHEADDVDPTTDVLPSTPGISEPVTIGQVNTRALARTAGLGVAISAGETPNAITTALALLPSLLTAEAVTSEAVAKCVDGQPVFDVGYEVAGLGGVVGGLLDPTLIEPLLLLIETLLGPGSGLSAVASIAPGVVTPLADGVAIEGLVLSVPLLNETIVISHSEVHMAADCSVITAPPDAGPTTGGATSGRLASTGSDTPFLAVGMGLTALALVGGGLIRRSRKAVTQ